MKNFPGIRRLPSSPSAVFHRQPSRLAVTLAALAFAILMFVTGDRASAQVDPYTLMLSSAADRSSPVALDGQTVSGNIFVFTSPNTGVSRVEFFVDNPSMSAQPFRVENGAPFDLAGTNSNGTAVPFDTNSLSFGAHNITARLTLTSGGTETASADFTVANTAPPLQFSPSSINFVTEVDGASATQSVDLAAAGGGSASFTLQIPDSPSWLSAEAQSGTTPATVDVTVDLAGLAEGDYSATVEASADGFVIGVLSVTLNVAEGLSEPDQVHLAWVDDPSTTLTVVWHTAATSTPSQVQYRPAGSATWTTVTGSLRPSGTAGTLHQVTLSGLTPDSAYEYRVAHDNGGWSEQIYSARTAPAPGPADFDLIFVADTGIVGRTDGLTTGTQQVIDEIASLEPDLVLLGGDYAYFDTDKRFTTLERTIDAWFNQVQPFASIAPLMPTYGNHEISPSLDESFGPWAARFPTPSGFDGRRLYSFDIGDAHFISITAWADFGSLPSSYVTWIQQDIQAARDAGKTWIMPYFHVSPFADGTNHPSNTNLRNQLGPIFEANGIDLVLTAHDQAYERTYPLSGIGSTNTPTTAELDCYTKSEGVTFAKVSPGGKLSNKNDDFSQFATNPAPSWTAVRNNTIHNFARLTFSDEGSMRLEVFGVVGDGTPPVIIDEFEYRTSACDGTAGSLEFSPGDVSFTHVQGGSAPADQTVTVSTTDSGAADVSVAVSPGAGWLEVTPTSGTAPLDLNLSVDPGSLAEGDYTATVTAFADGYEDNSFEVSLTVTDGTAPLAFDVASVSLTADVGETADAQAVSLTATGGAADVTLSWPTGDSWLQVTPVNGPAPLEAQVGASAAGLAPGTYNSTVTASATGFDDAVLPVSLEVTNPAASPGYSILYSTSSDRSSPVPLDGAMVSGNIYAFTSPNTSVTRVQFWLDNPAMTGTPFQTENSAPYDFDGTASNGSASPFNTATLINGSHEITARITFSDGTTQVVSSVFQVSNGGGGGNPTYSLVMSASANRSAPSALQGATVSGNIYVFTTPNTSVTRVQFWLDNPAMSSAPFRTENSAPYDFEGTASNGTALPFDTTTVTNGSHEVTARITLSNGTTQVVSGVFQVNNGGGASPSLVFNPTTVSFNVPEGGTSGPVPAQLTASDGASASFSINVSPGDDWLTVTPSGSSTPATVDLSVNAAGLAPGTYTAEVTATSGTHEDAVLSVTMTVGSAYSLVMSASANRSVPTALQGATVSGNIYVFTTPDTGVNSVNFFLDDPAMSGALHQTENGAPYDFDGTASNGLASPFDTATLANGPHSITARLNLSGGTTTVVSATFEVLNDGTGGGGPWSCEPDCDQVLTDLPLLLEFDGSEGGILDSNGVGTGFTWLDNPTNGTGYIPSNLTIDTESGKLLIQTTAGTQFRSSDSQDNALGVGVDLPSQIAIFTTRLSDIPAATGNFEQAGLWLGNDEDNYVKVVVASTPQGYRAHMLFERDGSQVFERFSAPLAVTGGSITLQITSNPFDRTVTGHYSIAGSDGPFFSLGTVSPPGQFFSFDAARIDPVIGTDSFGGIFATHRTGPAPLTFSFDSFQVIASEASGASSDLFQFDRVSHTGITNPTSMVWGPDDRLYVLEMTGRVHALTFDSSWNVIDDEVLNLTYINENGNPTSMRMALGITLDPASTADNVILWISHSGWTNSLRNAAAQSSKVSKVSGFMDGAAVVAEDVITGLPRSAANHSINSLHFGPDGRLYIAAGGNTGAGAVGTDPDGEFGTRPEMPLSSALLVADVFAPGFDGSCETSDILATPPCDVSVFVSGLRNMYDFVFHSNGQAYGSDNGLGVESAVPPSTTAPCGGPGTEVPPAQPDRLHRLIQGSYYGHPNPSRNECVFFDGSFQGVSPDPDFRSGIHNLGPNRSADGVVEYPGSGFCGQLEGNLLISNYSVGDNITRIKLSSDGLSVAEVGSLVGGFNDPLPLAISPTGVIFVGEFGSGTVTALIPKDTGCWSNGNNLPAAVLDPGSAVLDGKLYVVAGKNPSDHLSTVRVYDPAADTWSTVADLPGPAVENPAVAAHNGKLYVFGGSTGPFSGAVSNAAVFDPATGAWTALTPMPTARGGATASVLNGLIYIAGGMDGNGASVAVVEVFNPATGTWDTSVSPMGTRRDNPVSAVLNDGNGDRLYVFGGRTRDADGTEVAPVLNSVEAYNPATGTWTAVASMPTGRRTMAIGLLNGRAQIIGGERTPSGNVFSTNEEYDPASNTWRTLTPMPTGRHGAAYGTIGDSVYVVGGGPIGGTSFTDKSEVFSFSSQE